MWCQLESVSGCHVWVLLKEKNNVTAVFTEQRDLFCFFFYISIMVMSLVHSAMWFTVIQVVSAH